MNNYDIIENDNTLMFIYKGNMIDPDYFQLDFKDKRITKLNAEIIELKTRIEQLENAVSHNAKVVTDFMQNQITVQWATLKSVDE